MLSVIVWLSHPSPTHLFLTNLFSVFIYFCIACFSLGLTKITLGLEGWDWSSPLELGEFTRDYITEENDYPSSIVYQQPTVHQ